MHPLYVFFDTSLEEYDVGHIWDIDTDDYIEATYEDSDYKEAAEHCEYLNSENKRKRISDKKFNGNIYKNVIELKNAIFLLRQENPDLFELYDKYKNESNNLDLITILVNYILENKETSNDKFIKKIEILNDLVIDDFMKEYRKE